MKIAVVVFGILVIVTGMHQVQRSIDEKRAMGASLQALRYLPDGEVLKLASLGYNALLADLIWLRIIQVFGERQVTDEDYDWIFHALDVTTTLDPHFIEAYEAGGLVLTVLADHVEQSNKILEKGIRADIRDWRIPFMLGFNYFNFLRDYASAAKYMEMASDMPGRPDWVPLLAARLYVQAHTPHVALEFLYRVSEGTTDKTLKERLDIRMKDVVIERDLLTLEKAVRLYQDRFGERPENLTRLVERGILRGIPPEPFGGTYILNAADGTVRSSTRPDRMRIYHPEGRSEKTEAPRERRAD